jgi:hypothetical protein
VYRFVIAVLLIFSTVLVSNQVSEAHFFGGATKQVGNYQALFLSSPEIPSPGDDTFLNFSLLDMNGFNVVNLVLSIEIRQGESTVYVFPEKWYEFSDITQTYKFPREGNYEIIYYSKVAGDDKPVIANFDLTVGSSTNTNWQMIVIMGVIAVGGGVVALKLVKRKIKK